MKAGYRSALLILGLDDLALTVDKRCCLAATTAVETHYQIFATLSADTVSVSWYFHSFFNPIPCSSVMDEVGKATFDLSTARAIKIRLDTRDRYS